MARKRPHSEDGSSISDEDDMEAQLLSLSKKKVTHHSSPECDDDSDSSTDDDSDDEWTAKSDKDNDDDDEKGKKNIAKKGQASAESSSEEDGEINDDNDDKKSLDGKDLSVSNSSASEDNSPFDDGLGDDLMGDENDRQKLKQMTEKEREQELYNRMEKREALKTRKEIQHKLYKYKYKKEQKQNKKNEMEDLSEMTEKSESFSETISSRKESRRKTISDRKRSAMDELKQKRLEKKEKMDALIKKKEPLTTKDVYSDDDDDVEIESEKDSSDSSDSESSDVEDCDMLLENLDQLEKVRLSRHKLEQWVHLPFFTRLVIGCFVRMGIGNHAGRAIYRVVEITAVTESPKIYTLGKSRTNKALKVRHGLQERVFRMEYVSNQPFTESEFQKWREEMKLVELPLPHIQQIKDKCDAIDVSRNYSLKEDDIETIVREKNKFRKNPFNYAMKKNDLLMAKTVAEQTEDINKIEEISKELAALEERATLLDKQRVGNLGNVSCINQKNRKKNIYDAEKAVLEEAKLKSKEQELNPFTRRRTIPKMITRGVLDELKIDKEKNTSLPTPAKKHNITDSILKTSGNPKNNGDSDLFDVHDFNVEIDVPTLQVPSLPVTPKPVEVQCKGVSRPSLNLDEYKRRKGLM